MGYADADLFEDDASILDNLAQQLGQPDFATLKQAGTVQRWAAPVIQFPDLKFPTASSKIEIASAAAEAAGYPRIPTANVDKKPAGSKLRLLSPASKWLMNSSYHNDPKIGAKLGLQNVTMHPDDAAARGLAAGQHVRVFNDVGTLDMVVELATTLPRGVALAAKSRWPKLIAGGLSVNALNPGTKSDMAESSSVHGVEVEIARL
jgi:anaerobic selenocysteine-containing dehydrogenase